MVNTASSPRDENATEQSAPRDYSVDTITASNDVEEALPTTKPVDVPPDGGYGWICVACVFLINAHTWGINSSYGVFLAYYLNHNFFPGSTHLEFAFVGGLSISLALALAPIATICVGRYGTKTALSIGIVLQFAGLLGASWATQIWQLFLSQGVAFGFGMGFLFVSSVGIVPQWFDKKRSFANSIGTAGSGFGGLIYSLATNAMIQSIGLGWAFRVLAFVSCGVCAVCTVLIKDRNKSVGSVHMAFDLQLFKRFEFWLVLGWGFFSMLGYIVQLFSLPNYATSIGLTAQQGALAAAMLNLGQGIGRPFVGYFSDSIGRINMAGGCTFASGVLCLVFWIFAKNLGSLVSFAVITGTVCGTFWATIGPVSAEVVGLQVLPSALSITWIFLVLPCTFAEPIGLELRADSGNIYLHAQIFTGVMYLAAAVCLWFLRAWKISDLARKEIEEQQRNSQAGGMIQNKEAGDLTRSASRVMSIKSTAKTAKGLFAWQRV